MYSDEVRNAYRDQHNDKDNLIQINDVAFAAHAFVMNSIILIQAIVYRKEQALRVSIFTYLFVSMSILGTGILILLWLTSNASLLNVLDLLGYIKITATLIKYIPQIFLNHIRKSTEGYCFSAVLLDFTGGILSSLQLVLDAIFNDNIEGITGTINKLIIGIITLVYDAIFIFQKLYYRPQPKLSDEETPLLE